MIATFVRRELLGWSTPFLPRVAQRLAELHTRDGELRLETTDLVVPGARAGRRLKELLVEEAERRGARLVPPRVLTVGQLPELLYEPRTPAASGTLARRLWARVLREMPGERLGVVFRSPPAVGDLLGWTRLARIVHGLHEEVAGAGRRFTDVMECCSQGMLFADSDRWEVLAEAQATYEVLLHRVGRSDPGLERLAALEHGALRAEREIWLCGVAEMPRVAQRMLERVASRGARVAALVHAPETEAEAFDAVGCVRPEAWRDRPIPLRDAQLQVVGRPAEQADAVVGFLASLDGAYAPEEIVVAVPDEELLPYLEQRLAAARVPVHVGQGTPVERTRAARLLDAVADFVPGRRFEAGAALVRHPDLHAALRGGKGGGGDSPLTGDALITTLDRHFSEVLPARLGGAPPAGGAVGALARRLDASELLGRLRGKRSLSAWAPEVMALLGEIYGHRALERSRPADRRLLDALQALRRAALELHQLPESADEPCTADAALKILLDEVSGTAIAAHPDAAAVELLGWLELHLDDAPVAVVTGLNEHFLPESAGAHAFLPDSLRSALGIVDNERRYARDAYQLTALLHTREAVCCISGRRTAKGDPLRPSRLAFAVPGEKIAARVQRFYGEEAEREATVHLTRRDDGLARSSFMLPPERVLSAPEPIRRLSVSRFRAVLADPYLFALETVLGLRSLDDSARELDGLAFGNLAHETLEHFGLSSLADSTDPRAIAAYLDGVLDERVLARHGEEPLPAVRLQVMQLRARLHAFARWQAAWRAEGWRIVGVECRTPEEGVSFPVDGEPFAISGRIDRIDHHPQHGWAVLDYKTGDAGDEPEATHRKGRERAWVDLQLPLYRHLLAGVQDARGEAPYAPGDGAPVRLGYVLLPRDSERVGAAFAEWDEELLATADEQAREVVRALRRNVFHFDRDGHSVRSDHPLAALLGVGYLQGGEDDE